MRLRAGMNIIHKTADPCGKHRNITVRLLTLQSLYLSEPIFVPIPLCLQHWYHLRWRGRVSTTRASTWCMMALSRSILRRNENLGCMHSCTVWKIAEISIRVPPFAAVLHDGFLVRWSRGHINTEELWQLPRAIGVSRPLFAAYLRVLDLNLQIGLKSDGMARFTGNSLEEVSSQK